VLAEQGGGGEKINDLKMVAFFTVALHTCRVCSMHYACTVECTEVDPRLEFKNNLWGLGTEKELGYCTGPPEPVFLNF
jgi:hypothetical protein